MRAMPRPALSVGGRRTKELDSGSRDSMSSVKSTEKSCRGGVPSEEA